MPDITAAKRAIEASAVALHDKTEAAIAIANKVRAGRGDRAALLAQLNNVQDQID